MDSATATARVHRLDQPDTEQDGGGLRSIGRQCLHKAWRGIEVGSRRETISNAPTGFRAFYQNGFRVVVPRWFLVGLPNKVPRRHL
jgi:hypothetical protein